MPFENVPDEVYTGLETFWSDRYPHAVQRIKEKIASKLRLKGGYKKRTKKRNRRNRRSKTKQLGRKRTRKH